jgi:HlyD family secretion protein
MAKKRSSNRTIYTLFGVVVALIIFLVIGKKAGWFGGPDTTKVDIAEAKKTDITEIVSASGMIHPVTEVKISPDVAGEIIELNVEEGDSVAKGELLIKIRPDIYESSLRRAEANLSQQLANLEDAKARENRAEATYYQAQQDFIRNKDLREEKVISQADYETSEANFKVAKSDWESAKQSVEAAKYIVKSARAAVEEAQENLRFTIIEAPMSGTVSKLNVELGERVVGTAQMAGTEMLRIADLTKMEARVDVNENDIIRVSIGDSAIIDVDSYTYTGKKFKGIVTHIANSANEKVSADAVTEFEVRVLILSESYQELLEKDGANSPFRPGMTASVDIITEIKRDVLSVPLAAVTTRSAKDVRKALKGEEKQSDDEENNEEEEGKENNSSDSNDTPEEEDIEVVFLVKEGKAILTPVKTSISDFDNIQVTEGVALGDKIITGPFNVLSKRLEHNDLVEQQKEEEK